jgi:hypothetical protein
MLFAFSAGHCEFRGCSRSLFLHPITLQGGNFSNIAHIWAFSENGPRPAKNASPEELNDVDNLIVLCRDCHKLVDDRDEEYSVEILREYKRKHEERVRQLVGIPLSSRTTVLKCIASINDQVVRIPFESITSAIQPRYAASIDCVNIDLTTASAINTPESYATKASEIESAIAKALLPGIMSGNVDHISVFACGPMPLLVKLGWCIGSTVPTDLFQLHRDTQCWTWKPEGAIPRYMQRQIRSGSASKVGLMLNLSGSNGMETLPPESFADATIYEITLDGQAPDPRFLGRKEGIQAFKEMYRDFLHALPEKHPGLRELHLFPAAPAPIMVACGSSIMRKTDPSLIVHDLDRKTGHFAFALGVNQ